MPALQNVPGVCRVAISGTASGGPIVNILHFKAGGDPGFSWPQVDVQTLASTVATQWQTHMLPLLASDYVSSNVVATDLSSDTGNVATATMTGAGTAGALPCPYNVAMCISWKIARHYRGGHPRTYLGPVASSKTDNKRSFQTVYTTDVTTRATAFLTAMNGIGGMPPGLAMVAVHRYRNGAVLTPPLTSPILDAVADSRLDTQRRRLGRDV